MTGSGSNAGAALRRACACGRRTGVQEEEVRGLNGGARRRRWRDRGTRAPGGRGLLGEHDAARPEAPATSRPVLVLASDKATSRGSSVARPSTPSAPPPPPSYRVRR
ncbi:hypothetical protein SEVIR_6G138060v4 [Setaria viridis]